MKGYYIYKNIQKTTVAKLDKLNKIIKILFSTTRDLLKNLFIHKTRNENILYI